MTCSNKTRRFSLRKSLRLRLALVTALVVLAINSVGTYLDYCRERSKLERGVRNSLMDQARTLELGGRGRSTEELGEFVAQFCDVLNAHVSPGHVIVLIDRDGNILTRSSSPQEKLVQKALFSHASDGESITVSGHTYAHVHLQAEDGTEIIMAQNLETIRSALASLLISHIVNVSITTGVIILLIFLSIQLWVAQPIRELARTAKAWSSRRFTERAPLPGPSELRFLTEELHNMAKELNRLEKQRLVDFERARRIQKNLLPKMGAVTNGVKLSVRYWPLEHVAGDLYDVFELPDGRMVAAVIDLAGHGVSAALLTGVVKMSLRYQLTRKLDLEQALTEVNRDLLACTLGQMFAVLSVGVWNASTKEWLYAATGHEGCTIFAEGKVRHMESTGPMLGILPDAHWTTSSVYLQEGDRVFLYTDGVTEAGVLVGEGLLGVEGVEAVLTQTRGLGLDEQVERVMDEAERRGQGHATDDITLLAFEVAEKYIPGQMEQAIHIQ